MPLTSWWAEHAWLPAGVARDVRIDTDGRRITAVTAGAGPPAGATRLWGLVLPGLANAHSHAFHRALRGRTHAGRGDFWAWRDRMYEVAAALDPDRYRALARATYAEMALAGVTAVGEFHYVHHPPGGGRYDDPNELGHALVAAGRDAGVRVTLLDACYLQGDVDGTPLSGVQRRFGDASVEAWADRVADLHADGAGAAVHSVRACPPEAMRAVADWARARSMPLHIHLSEQQRENDACRAVYGISPTQLCADTGVLGPSTTAVHATHVDAGDVDLLSASRTTVCLCPTTERDLGDGVGMASRLLAAGAALALGSDSHAVIDLFEEARGVELDERLVTGVRGHHQAADLLHAATQVGMRSIGWDDAGRIEPGCLADLVAVRLDSPRLAGAPADALPAAVVFAATAADVTDVVCAGRPVVAGGRHLHLEDVGVALAEAIATVTA